MTFIPRQQENHCFIACSEDKVNAGFCDCINRMKNEALRQPPVSGRSEQLCENLDENYKCKKMCLTRCLDGNKFYK